MLASKEDAKVTVTAVVVVVKEQGTDVPLRRQGEARVKSVVRLIDRVFEGIAVDVSIFMASWSLADTIEFYGVTEMIKWAPPIIKNRPINIIILLQHTTKFEFIPTQNFKLTYS